MAENKMVSGMSRAQWHAWAVVALTIILLAVPAWGKEAVSPSADEKQTEADLKSFRQREEEGKKGGWKFLVKLPAQRKHPVARKLLGNKDTLTAYLAAGLLIRDGKEAETIPALCEIVVSGRAETDLNNRMGYDWVHSDDDSLAGRMLLLMAEYFRDHLDEYKDKRRERVAVYFKGLGVKGSLSKKEADEAINALKVKLKKGP